MSHTYEIPPDNWEIHHLDNNPQNNSWSNLILLHPLDHLKFHTKEELPF